MSYPDIAFALKNYLCSKKRVKYLIPVLAVFLMVSCSRSDDNPFKYEMLPSAPIPPQKYCFEDQTGKTSATAELTITGDSVEGKIEYAKSENLPAENFSGTLYGTTLMVKCRQSDNKSAPARDKEWKLAKDVLYVFLFDPKPNTGDTLKGKGTDTVTLTYFKVHCE